MAGGASGAQKLGLSQVSHFERSPLSRYFPHRCALSRDTGDLAGLIQRVSHWGWCLTCSRGSRRFLFFLGQHGLSWQENLDLPSPNLATEPSTCTSNSQRGASPGETVPQIQLCGSPASPHCQTKQKGAKNQSLLSFLSLCMAGHSRVGQTS